MPSRPAEIEFLAGLGLDGASCHRQTHSSCPEAAIRLIEPERRGCTVDYEVVPGIGITDIKTFLKHLLMKIDHNQVVTMWVYSKI